MVPIDIMPNFNMKTPEEVISRRKEMMNAKGNAMLIDDILGTFNISRPVFYKIYNRYQKYGELGLCNLSKAPHNHGRKTNARKEEQLYQIYHNHPYLSSYEFHELVDIPASTIQRIAKRNGFVKVYKSKSEKKTILERLKMEFVKAKKEKKSKKTS